MDKTTSTKVTNPNKRRRTGSRGAKRNNSITTLERVELKKAVIPDNFEKEDTRENILTWGYKNNYPYYLNYLSQKNAIHGGVLKSKRYYTVAGGLEYDGQDKLAWDNFLDNNKKSFGDKSVEDIVWNMSLNFEKSNMICVKVYLNITDRSYRKMEEIPFYKVRFETAEDKNGNLVLTDNIKVSENWLDSKYPTHILKPYDPNDDTQFVFYVMFKEDSGQSVNDPSQRKINLGIYPSPVYDGAIKDIDTGIEVANYNNSEIHNGFTLGTILSLNNGVPKNDEDRRRLKNELSDDATGSHNAGRLMVTFSNGKDREPTVLNLNGNDLPDRYNNTKTSSEESILHAHSVTSPILFGVKQEGSLGNATELENAFKIMNDTYFEGRRAPILSVLNWIAEFAGLTGEISFGEIDEIFRDPTEVIEEVVVGESVTTEVDQQMKSAFNDQTDRLIKQFSECGTKKEDLRVLTSKSMTDPFCKAIKDDFVKHNFQDLNENEASVLALIQDGQDFNTIRQVLEISGEELAVIWQSLQDLNLVDLDGTITDQGRDAIIQDDIERLEVRFEYRLRPDAPDLLPGGESRDFCRQLISLGRVYTKQEIDIISANEGYDVFKFRGGWYHDPNTNTNQPGCRHEWAQTLIFA